MISTGTMMINRYTLKNTRALQRILFRFNSSASKDKSLSAKDENDKKLSQFKVKQTTSASAPAPIEMNKLAPLLKQDNKPYIPKIKHERLTFEYPGLPNQDEFNKLNQPPNYASRWKRHLPKIATLLVGLWAAYSIKVWVYDDDDVSKSNELLSPDEFHPFIVTHKKEIDNEHILIEVKPKYDRWTYSYANDYEKKSIWNGNRIWSVEVKHPQIMVVRSYTPLPLYFLKSELTRNGEKEPLLKVINNDEGDCDKNGTMTFYVKKYDDGEVSKYLFSRKIGDEIELRGPDINFTFPYNPTKASYQIPIFRDLPSQMEVNTLPNIIAANKLPQVDNIVYYGAGTGIAPILQVLMSRNPYPGFVTVHYSAKNSGELQPLERFMFFLEKLDRAQFVSHIDKDKSSLVSKDFEKPEAPHYISQLKHEEFNKMGKSLTLPKEPQTLNPIPDFNTALEQAIYTSKQKKKNAAYALVCGPDGYLEYISGRRNDLEGTQGPVTGELGKKGWDNTNVYKL